MPSTGRLIQLLVISFRIYSKTLLTLLEVLQHLQSIRKGINKNKANSPLFPTAANAVLNGTDVVHVTIMITGHSVKTV